MPNKKKYVEKELSTLDAAISYALEHSTERNYEYENIDIVEKVAKISSRQQTAYKEFMRTAWGKAIRINSELEGELIYRLTQSAAIIPNADLATPNSSIGKLVNIAREGNEYESSILGEYTIEDVWYFERYVGREFVENIKNFKKMTSEGVNSFLLKDLSRWIKDEDKEIVITIDIETHEDIDDWDDLVFKDHISEEESFDEINTISSSNEGISLSNKFYVNLSEAQYDAAHSGANGLVFVFGVAGSGKTSVALGRSKSLAQLSQIPEDDKKYNLDFSEETQIGIVRTGELISYLKDTCNMLSLHRLPIQEYRTIVEELKQHWDIDQSLRSKNKKPKFQLTPTANTDSNYDYKKEYFDIVSNEMTKYYNKKCLSKLEKSKFKKITQNDGDFLDKVNHLIYKDISIYLRRKNSLIGYFSNLSIVIKKSIDRVFNESIWVGLKTDNNDIEWYSNKVDNIPKIIKILKKPLCLYTSVENVKIIIPDGDTDWQKWLPNNITKSYDDTEIPSFITLINNNSEEISIPIIKVNDSELLNYLKQGALRFYYGVGVRKLYIRTTKIIVVNMQIISSSYEDFTSGNNIKQWRSKMRASIIRNVQIKFGIMVVYKLYFKSIRSIIKYDKRQVFKIKHKQIKENQLDERDIDLILAFFISVTRGLEQSNLIYGRNKLVAPPYRSSVFIDEIQDFSEIQIYLLALLSDLKYNSVTAVGDSAQSLYGSTSDFSKSFPNEMWQNSKRKKLEINIRQQGVPTLSALGETFRNWFIDDVPIITKKYTRNKGISLFQHDDDTIDIAYNSIINTPKDQTIVVIVPTVMQAEELAKQLQDPLWKDHHKECSYSSTLDLSKKYLVHISTPQNIKGLEFDNLVALNVDEYCLDVDQEKNALYVMITRPTKELTLVGDFGKIKQEFNELLSLFADIKCGRSNNIHTK